MASKLYLGYGLAVIVTLAYSLWYLGLGVLEGLSGGAYSPIVPLLLIELISAFIVVLLMLLMKKPIIKSGFKPIYAVASGLTLGAGNYVFFTTIGASGVAFASSFATAEIAVFTLLLWISSRERRSAWLYLVGSIIVTAGLIIESFRLNGSAVVLNAQLIEYGTALALLYGFGTFFYYLSLQRTKNQTATMLYVQVTEIAMFIALLAVFFSGVTLPTFSPYYTAVLLLVAAALFLSFYGETTMVNMLIPFGQSAVSTGYILASLQLVPVLAYSLLINPGSWASYTPGIALIVIGSVCLQWK
jgi:hypothetical protein